MASNVQLKDVTHSYLINGWIVNPLDSELRANVEKMTIALSSSDETFLTDYDGRERTVSLSGVLIEGETLGTGTGMNVTALEDQVNAIETKFVNLDRTGITYQLYIYDPNNVLKQAYYVLADDFQVTRGNPAEYEFTMQLTEGSAV